MYAWVRNLAMPEESDVSPFDSKSRPCACAQSKSNNSYACVCPLSCYFCYFVWRYLNFRISFKISFRKHYRAELQNVDFSNDATRQGINKWVSDETNKKIENLLAEPLDPLTRMILVNAIYFKGDWAKKFDAKDTKKEKFYRSDGSSVDVDMMNMEKEFSMDYIRELKTKVLELPYKGESLSMIILLPDDKDGLGNLEAGLTADHLMKLRLNPHGRNDVVVALPRFILEESASLGETLSNMGVSEAFIDVRADFSKMDGTRKLFLSEVIHKAFIEVNEEGSEAAAATAVVMMYNCIPQVLEFRADHPFLFAIRCNRTKSFLFMGKMENPPMATVWGIVINTTWLGVTK